MESSFPHRPVMLREVLAALGPRAGGRYVDGTLGGGGHAEAILEASSPDGYLYGCDRDGDALEWVGHRLARFEGRFELRRMNFAGLAEWLAPGSCDGVLLDLGVSSPQLDRGERGFSFQQDGPLDMRMDRRGGMTAADWVNGMPVDDLARVFRELGEEPEARRLARALERERRHRRFETTRQLAEFIETCCPRRGSRLHPATRVFQALRMAVNEELESLATGLEGALGILRPGGRLAVISFHSGEDRVVKRFGRERAREYEVTGPVDRPEFRRPCVPQVRLVTRKPVEPAADEVAENPRARSARLRVMEKT